MSIVPTFCLLLSLGSAPEAVDTRTVLQPLPEADAETITIDSRSFKLPLSFNADAKNDISEVVLFVSTNKGKSWRKHEAVTPEKDGFTYTTREDGLYWFAIQIVSKNEKKEPARIEDLRPAQKVLIDTRRK
jgi:hypothetical protein